MRKRSVILSGGRKTEVEGSERKRSSNVLDSSTSLRSAQNDGYRLFINSKCYRQ